MSKLPNPYTTRGFVIWSLLFLLLVESVWTIYYLSPRQISNARSSPVASQPTASASAETSTGATLSLSPSSLDVKVGSINETEIVLNSAGKEVAGVTLKISYDPTKIDIVDDN